VWLKGGNVLNAHHGAGGQAAAAADEWPQDELGDSNVADLGDLEVRPRCCCIAYGYAVSSVFVFLAC
jgi:hypothetical protein